MINLSNFAERLSELMFDAKLKAPAFAKILGCGSNTVTRYIAKSNFPTVEMAVKIADYFKCSLNYLFGLSDNDYEKIFKVCPPFSERLPELLKHFNSNKATLEKGARLPQSAIYSWQNGKTSPDIVSVWKMSDYFKCSMDFIIGREK